LALFDHPYKFADTGVVPIIAAASFLPFARHKIPQRHIIKHKLEHQPSFEFIFWAISAVVGVAHVLPELPARRQPQVY
jgi:hypothetical protein